MYRVGYYTKNLIYNKKFGISFESQFGYMYWEVSKLSCHIHCIVNTQIGTRPLHPPPPPPNVITHNPISWKKVQ